MSDKISIVVACHGKGEYLPGLMNSIVMQRQYRSGISTKGTPFNYEAGARFSKMNVEVIICWDGDKTSEMMELFAISAWPEVDLKQIACPAEGGVGHHTREHGIRIATGDWIVCTNQDNFFMHGWLHSVVQCCLPHYGIVYWDMVSNLWTWKAPSAALTWGQVDLSSCCVRAEIAKEVGFPFRNYDGDWDYIDACSKLCQQRGLRPIHINEILSVHN